MQNTFTLHCIPWRAQAPLIREFRMTAYRMGLLSCEESGCDQYDESSNHALILSKSGKPLGCARITSNGEAARMAILPHEKRDEIEAALRMIAWLN